jgi:Flp pilus assembly protein TadG
MSPQRYQLCLKWLRRLIWDERGVVAIYEAFLLMLILAMGVLTIDFGRLVVLNSQIQNAADNAALAAASQLSGAAGARSHAETLAIATMTRSTALTESKTPFTIDKLEFFSSINPDVVASDDSAAVYARVTLNKVLMNVWMRPLLQLLVKSGVTEEVELTASATAKNAPIACNIPPLMVCDPTETMGPSASLFDNANVGKQMLVFESGAGGSLAPGNFGLLCTVGGDCLNSAIGNELEAQTPSGCLDVQVTTSPGAKPTEVTQAINSRFDTAHGGNSPARNVINYPRDSAISPSSGNVMGAGDWDISTYWSDHHGGAGLPSALSGATRYQTYLYELGETYARNGKLTLYPAPSSLPPGYATVTGATAVPTCKTYSGPVLAAHGVGACDASDPNYDGVPKTSPVNDPKRRVLEAVVLKCLSQNVQGRGSFDVNGRFAQFFITEAVPAPPDTALFVEILGALGESTSAKYHANVSLVK